MNADSCPSVSRRIPSPSVHFGVYVTKVVVLLSMFKLCDAPIEINANRLIFPAMLLPSARAST